ncbi:histidinol-phosphate transaminase [Mangrovimicrobium sediminis]|uniref:Histidinol-phosphate aminotransferase n=1 Tax=Mangrovimicrobium sediminis TaxID=2562682 RepID=A0A4Z0M7C7_9GAMM|nr:histidinol-phosphate transaminase [Haliea sp. SAOS-164]TGD75215.1 histidinol-phosphate transaminase [Haliea sp. SAOS-164]
MSRFWSELAAGLTPYVPGEQPRGTGLVKLNTNENPYPPAPGVLEALAAVSTDQLRRYPDPQSTQLREALAQREGLLPEQVFIGNGSDEVLAHTFAGLLKHGAPLLFPDVTYSFYPVWAAMYTVDCRPIPLREDFSIDVDDYAAGQGAVLLPNPNAPTGVLLPLAEIRRLLEANPDAVVVIDEAYVDFGGESAVRLVPEYDNLLVVQTTSKARSLAGLRVGMAYGHVDLIEALVRVKDSFNSYPLDSVAQQAALASVQDEAWFRRCCDQVIATRERSAARLAEMGFDVLPSAANFLFARHPQHAAKDLFTALRERKIIVRYFDKPRISEYLRISVGTDAEMDAFCTALEDIL